MNQVENMQEIGKIADPEGQDQRSGPIERAPAITLKWLGYSTQATSTMTGVPVRTVNHWWATAIARGFDLKARPIRLKMEHIAVGKRTGRPRKDRGVVNEGRVEEEGISVQALEKDARSLKLDDGVEHRMETETDDASIRIDA